MVSDALVVLDGLLNATIAGLTFVAAYLAYQQYVANRTSAPTAPFASAIATPRGTPQTTSRAIGPFAAEPDEERSPWEEYQEDTQAKEKLLELVSRRNQLEDMRKEARKQYLKRSIDDGTYKGLTLSLEKELLETNAQIKKLEETVQL